MGVGQFLGDLPPGITIKTEGTGAGKALGGTTKQLGPKDCDPATEKWSFREKACVPRMFAPKEGAGLLPKIGAGIGEGWNTAQTALMCGKGFQWKPGEGCVALADPTELPETPATLGYPEKRKAECTATGQGYDPTTDSCTGEPKPVVTDPKDYASCIAAGGTPEDCKLKFPADTGTTKCGPNETLVGNRCVPKADSILPPIDKTPSPFDNPEYYKWLTESGMNEEKQYYAVQEEMIDRTFDEGWADVEAQLSAMGAGYGTESQEIQAIYTRDKEIAKSAAWKEIMYTGLERRRQERKDAIDFYTDNREMELQYAISNGTLTAEMLKTYINADVAYAGIEVDMLDAITRQALTRSTIDVNNSTIYNTFMTTALAFGLKNEEAEDMWGKILADNSGSEQTQM